ncbi:F-type H+-transporting ATPase subunit epsilon [Enhydrobacter aerosaccus]|uniref:ATP synthase epsilon chain n=1 Tax=Enhydrobacter aerosaccus TaxID=225324 RepID=A0A1T4NL69_9HYPH|nr:F0F1 ATP synthase subunit epsilon [Enhydrobacter aerosaccus]SJZ79787.1 F-type H+-transporting ATPase subunit epsilon [Enhydrobacter aerosaccus]
MAKFSFRLVMPERELLAIEADMVVVPGSEGDFGVLQGHAPLISTIRPGVLEVYQGNKVDQRFVIVGGFAEVTPERCTVLADEAIPFEEATAEVLAQRERTAEEDLVDAASEAERAAATKDLAIAKELRRAQAYYASR